MKRKISIIILLVLLVCFIQFPSYAMEPNESWYIDSIIIKHKSISFSLSGVRRVEEATLVVKEYDTGIIICELPFETSLGYEKTVLEYNDGYFQPNKKYEVYAKDALGHESYSDWTYCTNELGTLVEGFPKVYPNTLFWKIDMEKAKQEGINVSVKAIINNNTYNGTIDNNGNVTIKYPQQVYDTAVKVIYSDNYGCEAVYNEEVEYRSMRFPSMKVFHDGIYCSHAILESDERLVVSVDNKLYYSAVGLDIRNSVETKIISYPITSSNSVQVWIEGNYGFESERKQIEVDNCDLRKCIKEFRAYPAMMQGKFKKNDMGVWPNSITAVINNKEYSVPIKNDGTFELTYPYQSNNSIIVLTYRDIHGCVCKEETEVYNSLDTVKPYMEGVYSTKAYCENDWTDCRLVAQIGDKLYYSQYNTGTVSYPLQEPGTKIKFWFECKNTSKSQIVDEEVYSGGFVANIAVNSKGAVGSISLEDDTYHARIKSVYIVINGKKYNCKISNHQYILDEWSDNKYSVMCNYSVKFPLQKIGTSISLFFTDSNDNTQSVTKVVQNIPPQITLDNITTSSKKVTGKTTPNSNITVKIGNKKYTGKSKSSGKFSIKIKSKKPGTKVTISVKAPGGHTSSHKTKIQKDYGFIKLNNYVLVNFQTVELYAYNIKNGDKITLSVDGRTYTKKFNNNFSSRKVYMNISKAKMGSLIVVKLIDKYGKTKSTCKDYVYSGVEVRIGMTSKQALNTTWGSPYHKEYWKLYGIEEWEFHRSGCTIFVYLKNGRVYNIIKLDD